MVTSTRLTGLVFIVQVLFIGLLYVMLVSQPSNISSSRFSRSDSNSDSKYLAMTNSPSFPNSSITVNLTVPLNDTRTEENATTLETYEEENSSDKPTTFLLIMVSIQPEGFSARECIRNTWYRGFNDSENVMMRFVIGTKGVTNSTVTLRLLKKENDIYGDIAFLENVKDHWITSTNKTLSMFIWAHDNVNFTYMMKTEESTFVYVKNMIDELRKRPKHTRLYYGKIQFKRRPIRRGSEWADPHWDLAPTYLPFALGGGYILSADLITLLVHRRQYLAYHPNEDTAVASWIAAYRFERRNDKLMCVTPFGKSKTLEGKCENSVIARFCYGLTGADLQKWFKILYEATINS
ncbi:beta-1,3-galactosyltransferase sqv-2-like [Dysidea avara]|uniref:beta-1,3-galactosyltransferase sqv-2-like n=1 Tax=Dysidea avara TaxID=196820 RepID=UPI003316E411